MASLFRQLWCFGIFEWWGDMTWPKNGVFCVLNSFLVFGFCLYFGINFGGTGLDRAGWRWYWGPTPGKCWRLNFCSQIWKFICLNCENSNSDTRRVKKCVWFGRGGSSGVPSLDSRRMLTTRSETKVLHSLPGASQSVSLLPLHWCQQGGRVFWKI